MMNALLDSFFSFIFRKDKRAHITVFPVDSLLIKKEFI